jgi:tripartite-type tricarboxylate transporter receptor subunit TctC
LQEAFSRAAQDPEFRAAAKAQGVHAVSFGPDVLKRRIDGARQLSIPLMKEMNLLAR